MPVYLFTFHAYRSWMPDHPRGFVQRDRGVQPRNSRLADAYDQAAQYPPVVFDDSIQKALVWIAHDVCQRQGWRLHAMATDPTHVHLVVSWRGDPSWQKVARRIKNVGSLALGRRFSKSSGHWFSRGGSRKRVNDRAHFEHLVRSYLPSHRGRYWREGQDAPAL
ncbi:MAG: transposase [Phycisphaeraceae bacterium]|nr:transposase [Phycisphaeraceae bacterium]